MAPIPGAIPKGTIPNSAAAVVRPAGDRLRRDSGAGDGLARNPWTWQIAGIRTARRRTPRR